MIQQSDDVFCHVADFIAAGRLVAVAGAPVVERYDHDNACDRRAMKASRPGRAAQAIAIDQADGRPFPVDLVVKRYVR